MLLSTITCRIFVSSCALTFRFLSFDQEAGGNTRDNVNIGRIEEH